jgi:alkaline phosphatase isozyme conversion protein
MKTMHSKKTKTVVGAMAAVLLLWLVSPLAGRREEIPPLSRFPLSFDPSQAYGITRKFVTQFPSRVLGSLEARQSTGYLHDYLEKLGYRIDYSHFDARIARRKQVGRNVLAYKQGQTGEIIAVIAHLDTAKTTVQGASENGSGVGVLLEMARVFAAQATRRSLLFILSDGGEWGGLGAWDLATSYPERERIVAVLSLDHVCIGDLAALTLEETGQLKGYTPPWLRSIALQAAGSQGLPVEASSGIQEHFERAFLISRADQGPFLRAGIPSINLGSKAVDGVQEKAISHSDRDTIENLKISSFKGYGFAAERIMRTLDELPFIPAESSDRFRLWDSRFLGSNTVALLHVIVFLPLFFAFLFQLKDQRNNLSPSKAGREVLAFLGTVLPFLSLYFFIALFRALRLLPFYSLYPAAIRDPVLQSPPWGILSGIFGSSLFVGIICYVVAKFSLRNLPKPEFEVSKLILLGMMLITVALALIYNSYWAAAFLLFPSWIWATIGCARHAAKRVFYWILIAAAGIPGVVALGVLASRLQLTWNFVWYQILALNTGLFSAAAYFLGTVVLALGIRFLAIQFHGRCE